MRKSLPILLAGLALVVGACGSGSAASPSTSSPAAVATSAAPAPSSAAPAPSSAAPSPTANACATDALKTVTSGKFTLATSNPAYPPYFAENKDGHKTKPWQLGDPTNGQGFEAAVGYAIAKQLGFTQDQVAWLPIDFDASFAPGAKTFDAYLGEVSYKPERAKTADLSDGYYFGNQSLVMMKATSAALAAKAKAGTLAVADLQGLDLGAQVGTTNLDFIQNVIKPTGKPSIYDSTDAAITALKNKSIDGIIVDLPTADYVTNVQLDGSQIIAQFTAGTPEHYSAVLGKGSPLTDCVNGAIKALTDDGTLKQLASTWLPFQDTVPVVKQ